jgi:hypothetical protein
LPARADKWRRRIATSSIFSLSALIRQWRIMRGVIVAFEKSSHSRNDDILVRALRVDAVANHGRAIHLQCSLSAQLTKLHRRHVNVNIDSAQLCSDRESAGLVNLSELDLEVLTKRFESSTDKRTEVERLTGLIERKLKHLIKLNHSRMDYLEQFQDMIDEYNSGSRNIEAFFAQLKE